MLVLAAASAAAAAAAASTMTARLFTFGHISYWYDRIITTVTDSAGTGLAARDSRYTVCLGTSS